MGVSQGKLVNRPMGLSDKHFQQTS